MNGRYMARAILVAALIVTTSCATNPATGARQLALISEAQEIQIGQQQDEALVGSGAALDNPALVAYVDGIGQRIAAVGERPTLPWSFRIMDDPTVNAFAMPTMTLADWLLTFTSSPS